MRCTHVIKRSLLNLIELFILNRVAVQKKGSNISLSAMNQDITFTTFSLFFCPLRVSIGCFAIFTIIFLLFPHFLYLFVHLCLTHYVFPCFYTPPHVLCVLEHIIDGEIW